MRALFAIASTTLWVGCSGSEESAGSPEAAAPEVSAVPAALLATSWQVRMVDATTRGPFEQHPGWSLLFQRDSPGALAAFSGEAGDARGLARVHLTYSALYRQALLLAAHATEQVYGADRQEVDPAEVDYLLGLSWALTGDCEKAGVALGALPSGLATPEPKLVAGWKGWVDAGCVWPPPVVAGTPGAPGEVKPGGTTEVGPFPHYVLHENTPEARVVEAGDPGSLWALAGWHEAAARATAPPEDAAIIDQLLAPWRLPTEPHPAVELQVVPDAWLFAGFSTSAADLAFAAAAATEGAAAVERWKDRSIYAAAIAPALVDGKVNPERMLDEAAMLSTALNEAMKTAAGGTEEGYFRPFTDLAKVGALRAAMLVADASDQYRDAGVLRINCLDLAQGPARDPVFSMAVSAWDAGNRNPLRAQELVHGLVSSFPSIEVARYPLDAMHIRLGRNAAPATASH